MPGEALYGLPPSKLGLPTDGHLSSYYNAAGGDVGAMRFGDEHLLSSSVYHHHGQPAKGAEMMRDDFESALPFSDILTRQNPAAQVQHEPQLCPECWMQNGRHSKKCSNQYLSETPEQRERRLKKEERLRDQDLGAGNSVLMLFFKRSCCSDRTLLCMFSTENARKFQCSYQCSLHLCRRIH